MWACHFLSPLSYAMLFQTLKTGFLCARLTAPSKGNNRAITNGLLLNVDMFLIAFHVRLYGTQNSLKSALDKKSIQFTSKQLRQALEQKDVVFYQAPAGVGRTFMWMYISAGVQLMFWYLCICSYTSHTHCTYRHVLFL